MSERQAVVDSYFEKQTHFWKSVYERHDVSATVFHQRHERSLQWASELRLARDTELLDIGCGSGFTSVGLARLGYPVHAVDHVPAMLDLTRRAAEQADVEALVYTSRGDICSLPQFPDNHFGLVVSLGVLAWQDSPQQALSEIYRVLRPGGHLIVSVGNRWCLHDVLNPPYNPLLAPLRRKLVPWFRRLGLLSQPAGSIGYAPIASWVSDTHRRASETDQMLKAAGFRKLKSASVGFGPFGFFKVNLFSDAYSVKLHNALQSLADRNFPILRSTGAHYMVLSLKPS
jgi:ubiquinone/menaquinone biosynthesis C-methylase UbiE